MLSQIAGLPQVEACANSSVCLVANQVQPVSHPEPCIQCVIYHLTWQSCAWHLPSQIKTFVSFLPFVNMSNM